MKRRLLVVDDEPSVTAMLALYFTRKGYDVRTTASAEDALRRLAEEAFDAVLLDNFLAGMSGLRALCQLRSRSRAAILLMTGRPDPALERDALRMGAAGVLLKPLDFDTLESEVRRLIEAPASAPGP